MPDGVPPSRGLRKRMPRLAAFLNQKTPFEHDVFADWQDALLEHRPHLMREPVVEIGAAAGVGDGDPLFVA